MQLVLEGFFNGLLIYRVVPKFLLQTGDPSGTGLDGKSIYNNKSFPYEKNKKNRFESKGMLGTAPDSQGLNKSQFFITLD